MAEKIPIRVQHRRKSASDWQNSEEILLAGELGVESDTGKVKVGDGTNRFSSLQYLTGPKGEQGETGPRGEKGDSVTVQSAQQLDNGNTQLTFSDGFTAEVQKGQDGTVSLEGLSNEQIRTALSGVLDDYARSNHTHDEYILKRSEAEFGRKITINGNGSQYAIFNIKNGSASLEEYITPQGDWGLYVNGENRAIAKSDKFEHHTNIDMLLNRIVNLPAPTANDHAVNKEYVDSQITELSQANGASLSNFSQQVTEAFDLKANDNNVIHPGDDDVQLGKHVTIDASDDGNYSASLFLKKNNHQYEFFTNSVGKFGAYDKAHSKTLFEADRNWFKHETNVDMSNNRIVNLPEPNGGNQPATKSWTEGLISGLLREDSQVITQLQTKIEELEHKVQTLESRSGQVKNINNNRWLDVGIYPNGQLPSNSTNRLLFEEE